MGHRLQERFAELHALKIHKWMDEDNNKRIVLAKLCPSDNMENHMYKNMM